VHAAFEAGGVAAGLGQHGGGDRHVFRLARMGGAGERDLLVGQAVSLRDAALDQGQGLDGLHGGARKDVALHVPEGQDRAAVGIDDGHAAAMAGFDQIAARDVDEERIIHEGSLLDAVFCARPVRKSKGDLVAIGNFGAARSPRLPRGPCPSKP
jgi:hypothetical protein